MAEQDKSKIEQLKKTLYSRKGIAFDDRVLDLKPHGSVVGDRWQKEDTEEVDLFKDEPKKNKLLTKIFLGTVALFFLSVGIATYVVIKGGNVVSGDKIELSFIGQTLHPSGEEFSLDIGLVNNNAVNLEIVDLVLEYPKGTKSVEDKTLALQRDRVIFGDVSQGQSVRKSIKAVLFGEEGTTQKIHYVLEYRIPNSNSVFSKEGDYTVTMGSAPVELTVKGVSEITSGQEITLEILIRSNAKEITKGVLLFAELPFGFEVTSATPLPQENGKTWKLGDIPEGGKRTVVLKGKVSGERNEDRFFKFSLGIESDKNPGTTDAPFVYATHAVAIQKPFISSALTIERNPIDGYLLKTNEKYAIEIALENNLPVVVSDIEVEAKITGALVDTKSISSTNGVYRIENNTIRWTKFDNEVLKAFSRGETTKLPFVFRVIENPLIPKGKKNQDITIDINVKGNRLSERNVPEELTSTVTKKLKIKTDFSLDAKVVRTIGSIENSGSVPPKVGIPTTYTIIWSVLNNLNEVTGAKVTGVLPVYVEWTDIKVPESEKISFNKNTREVMWDIGTLGVSSVEAPRTVSFQVSLNAPHSLLRNIPVLVKAPVLSGVDSFTGQATPVINKDLTTTMPSDPSFLFNDDKVVE